MTASDSPLCTDCGASLHPPFWAFFCKTEFGCDGSACQARLCKKCSEKHPLMIVEEGQPKDLDHATMKKFCSKCFEAKSTIGDFSKTYTTIKGAEDSNVTLLFVHGGTATRALFVEHALELKKRFGYGSILLDLPGHGTNVETPLTLDSATEAVQKVLSENGFTKDSKKGKLVYVGGSLGAYVGFYVVDKLKDLLDGAILLDCGQNVGPDASLKAKLGLVLLNWIGSSSSNAAMMKMMLGITKKSPADYKLIESVFGAGMYFEQTHAQCECLKAVAPAKYIPNYPFPVLFMNGSLDYRDSEDKWLSLCKHKNSELKVYEGGDHFFTHDSRFVVDILERFGSFVEKL